VTAVTSTPGFARFLMRAYPALTLRTSILTTLAGAAEAMGVVALVPALHAAISGGGAPDPGDALGRMLDGAFAWVGVPYTLVTFVVVVAMFMAAKGLFQWLAWRAAARAMAHIATDLRLRLVGNLFRAQWRYFTQQPLGTLATAVSHHAYVTAHAYIALCQWFAATLLVLVYIAAIAVVSPPAVPLTVIVGLLLAAPLRGVLRYSRMVAETETRAQQNFVTNLLHAVQSIKPIRAMGREESFETLARSDADNLRASIARQVSMSYLMPVIQEPILVIGMAMFVVAGRFVLQQDVPAQAMIVFALWRAGAHMSFANRAYRELVVAEPSYRQLQDLLDASHEAREADTGTRSAPTGSIALDLDHLAFAHGANRILDDLSMHIPAGAITAIVGESGVGKSTLIDLLLAFQRPAGGRILVNGVPLDEMSVRAWRRGLGYVPQETTLFHGTILENVRLGDPNVSDDDVREALMVAGAWDWVAGLERGVHTTVGEQGAQVSGGQRQRIAIARALARRPTLLLLDEFTASLDAQTEAAVIKAITSLRPNVTIVIATHQPALVEIADVVYRLEDKRATPLGAADLIAFRRRPDASVPSTDPADAARPRC